MSTLRFDQAYRTVISLGRLSGLPLPWYHEEGWSKRAAYACLDSALSLFFIYKCVCAMNAITHNEKVADIIFAGAQLLFYTNIPLLSIYYAVSLKKFKIVTDNMDKLSQKIMETDLGKRDFFEKIYKRDAFNLTKFSKILTKMTSFCPIMTCFSGPIIGILDGTYGTRFAVPTHCPFEENRREIYELIVINEFFGLIFPALQKLANEYIMLILLKMQKNHITYLREVLADIETDAIQYQQKAQEKLLVWIKLHQATISNAQDLIKFYSPMIALYYLLFTGLLAGTVLYQMKSEDNNPVQAAIIGIYVSLMVFQFYIQCHMADEVTKEAEKIAESAYRIPWYLLDHQTKGSIKLIITIANRPIQIMGYRAPGFRLSRENFVSFMTSSVSAYMAFSTIMENTN